VAATTEKPKYLELAEILRQRVCSGDLEVGARLPSYTELHKQYGASTATVQRACDLLDQEKLIERRQGSGVFVAAPQRVLTGTIGLIGSAGFHAPIHPFYSQFVRAVQNMLQASEQHLLYLGLGERWNQRASEKVDGVLICGVEEDAPIFRELPASLPHVSVFTSIEGVTSIGVDEYRGAQLATRHLLDYGHRRIALLMEKQAWEARRRVAGYTDALTQAGIETTPQWLRLVGAVGHKNASQPYLAWAREHMRKWLDDGWRETGCTAILAQNDVAAIGVMQILQEEGIRVPDDVSVMGFDGTEICDLVSPRLWSVMLPLAQIGAKAVELLNRQIAGEANVGATILLPLHLRQGESVARIAADP
jgi:DNA-binding LacI/PurR family transcriptional regulator